MQTYEIMVRNRSVASGSDDTTLVRTSIGIDQVHVLFDNAEWLEFPVTVTFGIGDLVVTESMVVNEVAGLDGWIAEGTVVIPWEVIQSVGPMRITLQGTDSNGRHIITAKGAPLSVVEAGDVDTGDVPQDAPSTDQWTQAYASALEVTNDAATLVRNLQDQINEIVASAEEQVASIVASMNVPATTESLGVVQIGDGLNVTNDGLLSAEYDGVTDAQERRITNIGQFVRRVTNADIDDATTIESCMVSRDVLPYATLTSAGAVKVDGKTITIDRTGVIRGWTTAVKYAHVGNSSYLRKALVIGSEDDGVYDFIDLRVVPSSAFSFCSNLRSVTFGKCVAIGDDAFVQCERLGMLTANACVDVGQSAFRNCYLLTEVYMSKCETLRREAFGRCRNLSYIDIPSCKQIGSQAFASCYSLTSISLPAIESIGRGAFISCSSLTTLDMRGISSVPYLDRTNNEVFAYTKISGTSGRIYVPSSLYDSFVMDNAWSAYSSRFRT